jgi:hypothetical protein
VKNTKPLFVALYHNPMIYTIIIMPDRYGRRKNIHHQSKEIYRRALMSIVQAVQYGALWASREGLTFVAFSGDCRDNFRQDISFARSMFVDSLCMCLLPDRKVDF